MCHTPHRTRDASPPSRRTRHTVSNRVAMRVARPRGQLTRVRLHVVETCRAVVVRVAPPVLDGGVLDCSPASMDKTKCHRSWQSRGVVRRPSSRVARQLVLDSSWNASSLVSSQKAVAFFPPDLPMRSAVAAWASSLAGAVRTSVSHKASVLATQHQDGGHSSKRDGGDGEPVGRPRGW
jgi:hypothetical protein